MLGMVFWLFVVAPTAAFAIAVGVNCYAGTRPDDISTDEWIRMNLSYTASDWWGHLRDMLKRKEPEPETGPRRIPGMARIGTAADAVAPTLPPPAAFGAPQPRSAPPLPAAPARTAAPSAAPALNGIPADHAAAAARIASFEPEGDIAMQEHLAGEAKGALARADAHFELCETLAMAIGLDPAYMQAAVYVAEMETEIATAYASLGQRLQDVYQLPYEHLDSGGTLPDPPGWLSAEGGA